MLSFLGLTFGRRILATRSASLRQRAGKPPTSHYFRPCMEEFEGRWVPAAPASASGLVAAEAAAAVPNLNITGVQLRDLQIVNNVLHATGTVTGTLAGLPFTTDITNFALQLVPNTNGTCSVLDLQLAPIHLNLLGLHVDTSPICLEITATQGGGILGDLLCGLAGGALGGALPTAGQIGDLQTGLTNILNLALNDTAAAPGGNGSACTGQCEVLDLVLGPLNLSLLGLNVYLDNCNNGSVEICVSATRSEGLLGSLLCGLSSTSIVNLDLADLTQLGSTATSLLADGRLSGRDIGILTSLLTNLIR